MQTLIQKVRVKNRLGLHTRPATAIVKLLQTVKSEVFFTHKKVTANAKSILSILMLAVQKNSLITITVTGEDAEHTMGLLVAGFQECFGESNP